MADSDALAYLRSYAGGPGIPLAVPTFDDDDELDIDDEPEEGDDEADDEDPEGEESDDDAVPGEGDEEEDDEAPGTASHRMRRVVAAVIPEQLVEQVARAPTPGGLFGAVAALLLLTVILVPANTNGATRLELVWRALTGGVKLPPTPRAQTSPVSSDVAQVEQAAAALWTDFWDATVGG